VQNVASDKARRRRFSAAYKACVLAKFEACRSAAERGALLRREGLYRSHILNWQAQRDAAALAGLQPRKRGRKPKPRHPLDQKLDKLEHEAARLKLRLRQTELIVEIQRALLTSPLAGAELDRRTDLVMQAISEHAGELGVAWLCSALGVPRASYYRRQRRRSARATDRPST
jgi:hypothetical protein